MIDLKAIAPSRGDKFSPNLWTWLRRKPQASIVAEGGVYRLPRDPDLLYIGRVVDDVDDVHLIGARLFTVMVSERERLGSYSLWGAPEPVADFFDRYVVIGRCAMDPEHGIGFKSRDGRWEVLGDLRTCRWCGLVQRKTTILVPMERWDAVAPARC